MSSGLLAMYVLLVKQPGFYIYIIVSNFIEILKSPFKANNHSLKISTLSNFASSAWMALLGILFVPVYLHYIGVESYGLIGIFNSLIALAWLFDFGLSGVINRELARLSAYPDKNQEIQDLTRTIEVINLLTAISITACLLGAAPLIARYWVQGGQLSVNAITQSLMIMGLGFAAHLALGFYSGGLTGLQKLPLLNSINVVCSTFRSVGSVLVLIFISSTIQAFLIWQVIIGLVQALLMAVTFHKCLPSSSRPARFRWHLLQGRKQFAGGLTVLFFLGLILQQLDKIILSKMLSLEFFGYYTLAATITSFGLGIVPKAIANAVYPRFSYLVERNEQHQLSNLYHLSTQAVSVLLLPAASILAVFPFEILKLWTQNETAAENTWVLLMILAIGSAIYGLINIPHYLQLAYGWTGIIVFAALTSIIIITPLMIITVGVYGAIAGAACWGLINLLHLIIYEQIMHKYTLKGEQWKWYFVDVAKPFAVAITSALLCRFVFGADFTGIKMILVLIVNTLFTYFCTVLFTDMIRDWILQQYRNYVSY